MAETHDLELLLKSGAPLIVVETTEEARALEVFRGALVRHMRPMFTWSIANGVRRIDIDVADFGVAEAEPELALGHIASNPDPSIYLLLDFHPYLKDPRRVRRLRELTAPNRPVAHTIVLVSPALELPAELSRRAASLQLAMPDRVGLEEMVKEEAFRWSRQHHGERVKVSMKALQLLVDNLQGLTFEDARRLARNIIYDDGAISEDDVRGVMAQKFELLNRGGVLSYEYETVHFDQIAGLKGLKRWVKQRQKVFRGEGRDYGLDPPKGVLLLGVQGCGKSMAAKSIAAGLGVPLLRLDLAALYNKYHGETERNLRESLSTAGVMAPCVLWIDELEKGLSVSDSDGGTSRRVLGSFLTWMAERQERVFLVATANDISALPPELMRQGRFDEIFFVDLPDAATREQIYAIHLARRSQQPEDFDLSSLSAASEGYSGAEIEQVVVSALYGAMAEQRPLQQHDLEEAVQATRPLSTVMREQVQRLRTWAAERCVPA